MNKFAISVFAGILLASLNAYANEGAKREEMFGKMKEIKVAGIQDKINAMQNALSCVKSASNHDQMKSCDEQERHAMESIQQQQKSRWEAMKQNK